VKKKPSYFSEAEPLPEKKSKAEALQTVTKGPSHFRKNSRVQLKGVKRSSTKSSNMFVQGRKSCQTSQRRHFSLSRKNSTSVRRKGSKPKKGRNW
jgi:hypothetical protein